MTKLLGGISVSLMDLSQRVKQLELRQGDIAATLGVSKSTVSCWINREYPIPTIYLRPMAAMLKVTVDDLLPPHTDTECDCEAA